MLMTSRCTFSVAIIVVVVPLCLGWSYEHIHEWGTAKGPNGDLLYPMCALGNQQSPISLSQVAFDATLKPLRPAWPASLQYSVTNNGHTIQFTPLEASNVQSFVDPNSGAAYNLAQFHFHSPSEHAWGGSLLDAEVHMVHTKISGPADASSILVVGVGFSAISVGNDAFFDQFWGALNSASVNSTKNYISTLDFRAALPLGESYVTYSGSLTTPPCTEGVRWYVMSEPQWLSSTQLSGLRLNLGFANATAGGNWRPVQALNGRLVRQFGAQLSDQPDSVAFPLALAALIITLVLALVIVAAFIITLVKAKTSDKYAAGGEKA